MSDALATQTGSPSASSIGKSWVQTFIERARGERSASAAANSAQGGIVRTGAQTLASMLEGGSVSALLGAAHAKFGLDSGAGPIDGWVAGLGAVGAVAASRFAPGLVAHAVRVSQAGFDVLMFRKAYELIRHAPIGGQGGSASLTPGVERVRIPSASSAPHSVRPSIHGDPIEAAAKDLR